MMALPRIALLVAASFSAAGGQLLFKVGAQNRRTLLAFINFHIGAGIVLYGLGTLIWIYALSTEKLVTVYAFTALTFVLVYVGGVVLLGESLNRQAMIGVVCVLGGLYLITMSGG